MRGALRRRLPFPIPIQFQSPCIGRHTTFSTSSGRGRGRGHGTSSFDANNDFTQAPGEPSSEAVQPPPPSLGHARGKPSWDDSTTFRSPPPPPPSLGHGRGRGRPSLDNPTSVQPPLSSLGFARGKPSSDNSSTVKSPPFPPPLGYARGKPSSENATTIRSPPPPPLGYARSKPTSENASTIKSQSPPPPLGYARGKPSSENCTTSKSQSPPPPLGHARGKPSLYNSTTFQSPPPPLGSSPGKPSSDNSTTVQSPPPPPFRGKPIPLSTNSFLPSFSAYVSSPADHTQPQPSKSQKPIFFSKDDQVQPHLGSIISKEESNVLPNLFSGLAGTGRGKPAIQSVPKERKEDNRHLRTRQAQTNKPRTRAAWEGKDRAAEAGTRGRGRGRGRRYNPRDKVEQEDSGPALYLGSDADGERLSAKLGPDNVNKFYEAFEEMSNRVLPSPLEDAYLDALHTNCLIEFEPEYLMEEFGTNPDIDEKPPIPLRDALEKMKPFLMAYENIQSQEEWEEVVKETMEKVPHLKELVDHYSGPDRVTAKQQQQKLERVASTLPASTPASVSRFANRAVLSLQSNPGWGFDKKCQFMANLVAEVSQHYK